MKEEEPKYGFTGFKGPDGTPVDSAQVIQGTSNVILGDAQWAILLQYLYNQCFAYDVVGRALRVAVNSLSKQLEKA